MGEVGDQSRTGPDGTRVLRVAEEIREPAVAELSIDDLNRYGELKRIHENERLPQSFRSADRRYRAWLERGSPPAGPGADFVKGCELRDHLLKHDYTITDWRSSDASAG